MLQGKCLERILEWYMESLIKTEFNIDYEQRYHFLSYRVYNDRGAFLFNGGLLAHDSGLKNNIDVNVYDN